MTFDNLSIWLYVNCIPGNNWENKLSLTRLFELIGAWLAIGIKINRPTSIKAWKLFKKDHFIINALLSYNLNNVVQYGDD